MNNLQQQQDVVPDNISSTAGADTTMVTFAETAPTVAVGGTIPLYRKIGASDSGLNEFLSRPLRVVTASSISGSINYDLMSLYFANAAVQRKLKNYRFIRYTFNLRFSEATMPFVYGKRILALQYVNAIPSVFPAYSKLPHVYIDPNLGNTYEMAVPHVNLYTDYHSTSSLFTGTSWTYFTLDTFVPYQRADSAVAPEAQYTIQCWLTDVELAVPVLQSGAGEYKGVISFPASIVADVAATLKKSPILAPFMTPIEIAARYTAGFAALFGWSKPTQINSPEPYLDNAHYNMYSSSALDTAQKLTLDPKQGVVASTKHIDGSEVDNLAFNSIMTRMTMLRTLPWTTAMTQDYVVMQIPVTPFVYVQNDDDIITLASCAEVARYFKYWKGTMRYTFSIAVSKFHKGRLRFLWSPTPLTFPLSEPISNLLESVIVDVTTCTEVNLDVKFASALHFAHCYLTEIDDLHPFEAGGNGYIYVLVHQELTAPYSSADATIITSVAAHEDVEFIQPSLLQSQVFHQFDRNTGFTREYPSDRYTAYLPISNVQTATANFPRVDPVYQSSLNESLTKPMSFVMNEKYEDEKTTSVCAGERIISFRTLMKAYMPHEAGRFPFGVETGDALTTYFSFPIRPFSGGALSNGMNVVIPNHQSPLTDMQSMFVGTRGSVRYKIILHTPGEIYNVSVFLARGNVPRYGGYLRADINQVNLNRRVAGQGIAVDMVNNSITFEVPYYYARNALIQTSFGYEKWEDRMNHAIVMITGTNNPVFYESFVAIGEDYSNQFYTGTGTIHVYDSFADP